MQFKKTAISCLGTALQEVRNAEVTQELRLSEGMPDIGRVLTTWGQIMIRSKEWQGSDIILTGGVKTWTLYAPEDGTEPRSLESWIPFQVTWKVGDVNREGPVRMVPLLRFADSRSISSRKMIIRAGVAALAQALQPMEAEVFLPEELPEDIQILKRTYPVRLPVECGEKTILVDDELLLPETSTPMEKLLSVMVTPELKEKRILSDKVIFKGNLLLHLVGRNQDGRVESYELSQPFSQLSELDKTYGADAKADIQMAVTSLDATLEEGGKLRIKCGLAAQYLVDDQVLLDVVEDAYSPLRPVTIDSAVLELPVILDDRSETIHAEQVLPGQEGTGADVLFMPDFPRKKQTASGFEMELAGVFQALIYGENELLQGINARWEGKLHYPTDEHNCLLATAQPQGIGQSIMAADGVMLAAAMKVSVQASICQEFPMVTGLEVGQLQDQDPSRPSVVICNYECGTLWELAKQNGSTVAAIRSANGIEGEPAGSRMLLIPVL